MDTAALEQQIQDIEQEIFNTQKNKATEHHIGRLKAKLAQLKEEFEKKKTRGGKGKGFAVKKSGDATVGIIGFPSIGKSTLLNQLTAANSRVGDYDFTTLNVIPGMMKHKGAHIQLLDLPGFITGASKGRGRGKEILSAIRTVDLIILMINARHLEHLGLMEDELYNAGVRLNQEKPDVVITRTDRGGITITTTILLSRLSQPVIKAISSEYLINADIIIREDITEDQLIDVFMNNRRYINAIVTINKIDILPWKHVKKTVQHLEEKGWTVVPISAKNGTGLNNLKETCYSQLKFIRVYLKPVGGHPDFDEPLILHQGDTVEDACTRLHKDFHTKFKYAQVWGRSVKYPGQTVGLDHVLQDEDVLSITMYT
jgi:hypothetical protein